MAETKGNEAAANTKSPETEAIEQADGLELPVRGQAVQSVTTEVPHEADASSAPGPYNDLPIDRPPVSSNDPRAIVAHSLVAGAGAPHTEGQSTPAEDRERTHDVQFVDRDRDHVVDAPAAPKAKASSSTPSSSSSKADDK